MRLIDVENYKEALQNLPNSATKEDAIALLNLMPTVNPETLPIVVNLKQSLDKVTKERDAAIADLRGCALESYAECMYCKNKDKRTMCAECKDGSNWKWSGFQEVKDE